jgi:hypothetical protein
VDDPATWDRIIRLSREPGTSSLYFHQNAYTDRGDKLFVMNTAPRKGPDGAGGTMLATIDLATLGAAPAKRLVNFSKHNYKLEPNLTFSPDNKWIIFHSNMHGPTHVYAVEIAKSEMSRRSGRSHHANRSDKLWHGLPTVPSGRPQVSWRSGRTETFGQ